VVVEALLVQLQFFEVSANFWRSGFREGMKPSEVPRDC
jgi:hypothetical protein